MNEINCNTDFTHLRTEMTKKLAVIAKKLEHDILTIDQNDIRILNDIEEISKGLADLESRTSTYFLNCLLAEYTEYSAEISRTIHKLSLNRHGALIVIEKNDSVSPLINGGTSIQARISSQLLESIFHPESPLHNGAVLLQSDVIISAANKLPFTEQIFWDRSFDPREMAAVGLSERCDALILLVSDKGSTSFSVGGRLYPFSAK